MALDPRSGAGWTDAYQRFLRTGSTAVELWGVFEGLFGVASNELMVMAVGGGSEAADALATAGFEVVDSLVLEATARPERFDPLREEGVYVFRIFDVAQADATEIARLSSEAWVSFENAAAYKARAAGLFRQAESTEAEGRMVLLTWYDGLESWEASRASSPEARTLFRQRRELTRRTVAYATRLMVR